MDISLVSWNLCGLGKLSRWPDSASWLCDHDVIFIQESLQVTKTFHFEDSTRFDFPAVHTGGVRGARGGLIISLRNRRFGNSKVSVLVEEEYALAILISFPASDTQLLLVNVYVPVHTTGFDAGIVTEIQNLLELLASTHPLASIVIAGTQCLFFSVCIFSSIFVRTIDSSSNPPHLLSIHFPGDFNGHLFAQTGRSPVDINAQALDVALKQGGFHRFPMTEEPFTFRGAASFSTIDYVYSRGVQVGEFSVARFVFF